MIDSLVSHQRFNIQNVYGTKIKAHFVEIVEKVRMSECKSHKKMPREGN